MTDPIPLALARQQAAASSEPPDDYPEPDLGDTAPFQALGHDRGRFFFLCKRSGQITDLTARLLRDEGSLIGLAPLGWWEREYPAKQGFDRSAAANSLISACYNARVFDYSRLRGRGAWLDDGRTVLHLGDRLIVDGVETPTSALSSRAIYEEGVAFGVPLVNAMRAAEAHRFLEVCELLRWQRPWMATVLAGWCVIAPLCGALAWRPHLWLTGESQSGKSWVYNNIIRIALAGIALPVQGKTTEAGIRRALRSDARPVIFEEAEAQTPEARARLQSILNLARAASQEDGPAIYQGSQSTGAAVEYRIRSSFAMCSINPMLEEQADENRWIVLSLLGAADQSPDTKRVSAEHFTRLRVETAALMAGDFSARLLARSLSLLSVIRANAETYATVGAEFLPSRRHAEVMGAVLAGAASLHHSRAIDVLEARATLTGMGWLSEIGSTDEADHDRLISYLCQQTVTVLLGNNSRYERTIGDLIAIVGHSADDEHSIPRDAAHIELRRMGITITDGRVWISNSHSSLARLLADTPWAVKWSTALRRIGIPCENPIRFGPGSKQRAIGIPIERVVGA